MDIFFCGLDVSLGREARETFLENKYAQRVAVRDEHVDPQVKLQAADQQRVADVGLAQPTKL